MNAKEDMLVIGAYRALRDMSSYPPDQVLKDLNGTFAFVLYDASNHTIFFATRGKYLCIGEELRMDRWFFSDDSNVLQDGCDKFFASFPPGCMFWNGGGLQRFEHPLHKMQVVMTVDSEGQMCGATFRVDKFSIINSIPRVGSACN